MSKDTQPEIVIGLSDEEKDDLEKMIKTFREDRSAGASISNIENVEKQIVSIGENLAQLGDMLLNFGEKMKPFYKIIHLYFKKDAMLNRRIDDIVEIMKGQETLNFSIDKGSNEKRAGQWNGFSPNNMGCRRRKGWGWKECRKYDPGLLAGPDGKTDRSDRRRSGGGNLHTLLGIKSPPRTVNDFITRKFGSLEEICIDTGAKNLRLISGSSEVLSLANPHFSQKVKLINHC